MSLKKSNSSGGPRWLYGLALAIFLAIAAFFLFTEHRAHLLGALPYILLLVCVAILALLWRAWRLPSKDGGAGASRPETPQKGGISHEP